MGNKMHKYLIVTAAAMLTGGTAAHAGSAGFVFGDAKGRAYCDGGSVTTAIGGNAAIRAWTHVAERGQGQKSSWGGSCSQGGTGEGQGLLGKVKGLGTVSDMSDNLWNGNYGNFSEQMSYALPAKIKSGQPWSLWIAMNGTTSFEANSGVLVDTAAGANRNTVAATLKQLTRQRGPAPN